MKKINKFDPKIYRGKGRVYSRVSGRPGISKLWIWNNEQLEYQIPVRGKAYFASRKILSSGKRETERKFFENIEEAANWQADKSESVQTVASEVDSPTFSQVVESWTIKSFAKMGKGTQVRYQDMLRKYFTELLAIKMADFDTKVVDKWIESLLRNPRTSRRLAFKHELDLLSSILRFYQEHSSNFVIPIKKRHRKEVRIAPPKMKNKDLVEPEFLKFRDELELLKDGKILSIMATVQYYQALRVSEIAAICWDALKLDFENPSNSRLLITQSVKWARRAGIPPQIEKNFKNSKTNGGVKEQPVFPESFKSLMQIYTSGESTGLIFTQEDGSLFSYRTLQQRFNTAFKNAGLDYSATHVMRHGGCRNIYNKYPDLAVAKQLLGNSDMKSVLVYAQRNTEALNQVAAELWKKK